MTKLDCSVKNCVHNSDNCCCKEAIVVDGCKAKECCETCCGSFSENDGGMFKNLFKTPEKSLKIDCEAVNCKHNEDHRCTAGHIGDYGHANDKHVLAGIAGKLGADQGIL